MNTLKRILLTPPNVDSLNFLKKAAQNRPVRKGGIRLEHELINDKHIFHNYGHGGAGISLGYGSAYASVEMLNKYIHNSEGLECAVIGSGIIGIYTALELKKRGLKVNVYADKIPKAGDSDIIASQLAAGKWHPSGYDYKSQPELHEKLSILSYTYYEDQIKKGLKKSLNYIQVYESFVSENKLRQILSPRIVPEFTPIEIDLGNGIPEVYLMYKTISFETDLLLEQLLSQAKNLGIQFLHRRFQTLNDVLDLKQKAIWNCTGYASKYLFNDNKLYTARGHLLYFKNTNAIDYVLSGGYEHQHTSVYGIGDRVMVGITYQRKELTVQEDELYFTRLLNNVQKFYALRKPVEQSKL